MTYQKRPAPMTRHGRYLHLFLGFQSRKDAPLDAVDLIVRLRTICMWHLSIEFTIVIDHC